jgi:hypothetical protein
MFSVDRYLDRTYDRRNYHCWHLIAEAWRDLTGEELELSQTGRHGPGFERVDQPTNPCIVMMIQGGKVPHAGLYRNGRVLHIRQTGARFERLADATRGFAEVRYYAKRHSG